jgi:hypothetical protein
VSRFLCNVPDLPGAMIADAKAVVRRSADRHAGWIRGDYDHLT